MAYLGTRGWDRRTDVIYTTDHGELQGDYGMLFKGPYHVNALTQVPLVWRPAPVAGIAQAEIAAPVGHVDIAPTILAAIGLAPPPWMQGAPLPVLPGQSDRERVFTEWTDSYDGNDIVLRSMVRDGWLVTVYEPTNRYDGSEGELHRLVDDPHQWRNLWNEAAYASIKRDVVDDLRANLPEGRPDLLPKVAPV